MFPQIFPPNQHFQGGHSLSRIALLRGALSGVTWVVWYELGILYCPPARRTTSRRLFLFSTPHLASHTLLIWAVWVWGGQKRGRVWSRQSDFGRVTRRSCCRVNSRTRIYSNKQKNRHANTKTTRDSTIKTTRHDLCVWWNVITQKNRKKYGTYSPFRGRWDSKCWIKW